jgi:putative hydrolase of the HAD superfamily
VHKAIIFDLGRVLIDFDFKRGYQALEGLCPYRAAEIPGRLATCDLVERFETGLIEPRDFVAEMSAVLDLKIDYDRFCRIWSSIFTGTLVPENLLAGLAARYRLMLLSNTNAIHFEGLRASHPMLRHFHDLVLSYEVKAMKPRPEIFQAAIARAGLRDGGPKFGDRRGAIRIGGAIGAGIRGARNSVERRQGVDKRKNAGRPRERTPG